MDLIPVLEDGTTTIEPCKLPAPAIAVLKDTAAHYAHAGFSPLWASYIGVEGGIVVGSCAFVAAPADGEVEIAYYTFPQNEGRGVATRMAMRLIEIAAANDPSVVVKAHTLPEENASTAILRRLGFGRSETIIHPEDGEIWVWRSKRTNA